MPDKKKKHRAHNENRLHAHQEVHIHITEKKKAKRRRRKPKTGHGGAVVSTMHSHVATAQPSYPVYLNRPQFFDPTTQADRERNQPMANMPAFNSHVPAGNGFNTQTPRVEIPHRAWYHDDSPVVQATPLTEKDEDREQYHQFRTPYDFSPLKGRYSRSVSPSYSNLFPTKTAGLDDFEDVNPMQHSGISAFEDTTTAGAWYNEKLQNEKRAKDFEDAEQTRASARKTAAAKRAAYDAERYQTKLALAKAAKMEKEAEEEDAIPVSENRISSYFHPIQPMSDAVSSNTRSQTGPIATRMRSKLNPTVKQTARGP